METLSGRSYRLTYDRGGLALAPLPAAAADDVIDLLPDSVIARDPSGLRAWLGGPTERYGHGILGDRIEASRLYLARSGEAAGYSFIELGPGAVFEDLQPRFVDADGDGRPEILVVKSYLSAGSAAALYRIRGGKLFPVA